MLTRTVECPCFIVHCIFIWRCKFSASYAEEANSSSLRRSAFSLKKNSEVPTSAEEVQVRKLIVIVKGVTC